VDCRFGRVYFVIFCSYGQSRLVYMGHKSCLVGALQEPALQNLTVSHLIKKSVTTNGTRRFSTVSCKIPPLAPILNKLKAFYTFPRYLRPSFICPFSPRCRYAIFLSGFPLICVCNPMVSSPAVYPTKLISDLITIILFSGNIRL
jgi:hypothetical protein